MRVTDATLNANDTELVHFSLSDVPTSDRFLFRSWSGMATDAIVSSTYAFGASSNKPFLGMSMPDREIVLRLYLNPVYKRNETPADLRDEIYRIISSSRTGEIELRLYSSAAVVGYLMCTVTKVEAGYVNQMPEVQITFKADNPLIRGVSPVRYLGADLPAVNPMVVGDNQSTAPHGFEGCVTFTSAEDSFTVQEKQTDPDWTFTVTPNGGFQVGDKLLFSSDYNNTFVYMDRSSTITHLVDKVQSGSVWPMIFPGWNELYFQEWGSFDLDYVEWYSAYWGV